MAWFPRGWLVETTIVRSFGGNRDRGLSPPLVGPTPSRAGFVPPTRVRIQLVYGSSPPLLPRLSPYLLSISASSNLISAFLLPSSSLFTAFLSSSFFSLLLFFLPYLPLPKEPLHTFLSFLHLPT